MLHTLYRYFFHRKIKKQFPTLNFGSHTIIDKKSFAQGFFEFGQEVQLMDYCVLSGKIAIGDFTYLNRSVEIMASQEVSVEIGSFCSIGRNVSLFASNDHDMTRITTYPLHRLYDGVSVELGGNIIIGHDVWIGAQSIILPGANIGTGAIIGAGSVVVQDSTIGPYEIWAGNPAKKIKDRFSETRKKELLHSAWWQEESEAIRKIEQSLFHTPKE